MPMIALPNGKQQFLDGNGDPIGAGSVFMYIPGTTVYKDTWADPDMTVLNTNPIILDANGEAMIYGSGQYRQIVRDVNGNTLWDEISQGFFTGMGSLMTTLSTPYSTVGAITEANGSLNWFAYKSFDLNWVRYYLSCQIVLNGTGSDALIVKLPYNSGVTSAWAGASIGAHAGVIICTIQQGSNLLQLSDYEGAYVGYDGTNYFAMLDMVVQ